MPREVMRTQPLPQACFQELGAAASATGFYAQRHPAGRTEPCALLTLGLADSRAADLPFAYRFTRGGGYACVIFFLRVSRAVLKSVT